MDEYILPVTTRVTSIDSIGSCIKLSGIYGVYQPIFVRIENCTFHPPQSIGHSP